jgi:hypothetical protein
MVDVDGLILDIKVAFGLPAVVFALYWVLCKLTPHAKIGPWLDRLFLSLVLLGFAVLMTTLMYQDSAVLKALWRGNPLLYSLVYAVSCVVIVAGLGTIAFFQLRPALWQRK